MLIILKNLIYSWIYIHNTTNTYFDQFDSKLILSMWFQIIQHEVKHSGIVIFILVERTSGMVLRIPEKQYARNINNNLSWIHSDGNDQLVRSKK